MAALSRRLTRSLRSTNPPSRITLSSHTLSSRLFVSHALSSQRSSHTVDFERHTRAPHDTNAAADLLPSLQAPGLLETSTGSIDIVSASSTDARRSLLNHSDFVELQRNVVNLLQSSSDEDALQLIYSRLRARRAQSSMLSPEENWQFCVVFLRMITFYFDKNKNQQAIEIFESLQNEGVTPDLPIYNTLLSGLTKGADSNIFDALKYFDLMKKKSIDPDSASYNIIIKRLIYEEKYSLAMRYFDEMKAMGISPSKVTHNLILQAYGKMNRIDDMVTLFKEMEMRNQLDAATYTTLVCAFVDVGKCEEAKQYKLLAKSAGISLDAYAYNRMVSAFCEHEGWFGYALSLYEELQQKGFKAWNGTYSALINAAVKSHAKKAEKVAAKIYREAIQRGMRFSSGFCTMLLLWYAPRDMYMAKEIWEDMKRFKIQRRLVAFHILMKDSPTLEGVQALFSELKESGLKPEIRTFNILIDAGVKHRNDAFVMQALEAMRAAGVQPDVVTHNIILKDLAEKREWSHILKFLAKMRTEGLTPNVVTYNTITHALVESDQLAAAKKFFDEMRNAGISPNASTYTAFITAFAANGHVEHALSVFDSMKANGVEADHTSYTAAIGALLSVGRLEDAKKLREEMKEAGIKADTRLAMKFLQYFVKINDLDKALEYFESMPREGVKKDATVYGFIIHELSRDENLQNVKYTSGNPLIFRLFNEMRYYKIKRTRAIYQDAFEALRKLGHHDRCAKVRADARQNEIDLPDSA